MLEGVLVFVIAPVAVIVLVLGGIYFLFYQLGNRGRRRGPR